MRHTRAAKPIPVIDLFAGPGGLGEGFSALNAENNAPQFEIRLSIEKDPDAHQTLGLRAFFRQFPRGQVPEEYYRLVRGEISRAELFSRFPQEAEQAAFEVCPEPIELKEETASEIRKLISIALHNEDYWVLLGGPPCQLYSVAGRSRNKNVDRKTLESDARQRLYVEYLQVIADHGPAVFVMENVKGLLTATLANQRILERIVQDLEDPAKALAREGRSTRHCTNHTYRLYALNKTRTTDLFATPALEDFLLRAEVHGVPQARHRLIIVGVRDDIEGRPKPLPVKNPIRAADVLLGLPKLRSGLSRVPDDPEAWLNVFREGRQEDWAKNKHFFSADHGPVLQSLLLEVMQRMRVPSTDRGAEFVRCNPRIRYRPEWFLDARLGGVCNHRTRTHMKSDLYRYLFAACFARVYRRSPDLKDFPKLLLPEHRNVQDGIEKGYFDDRFYVQLPGRPSTTVTSHLAKDGHHFIHYDPRQCRSLTVREAARLQTFPDNYYFCGMRTAQYVQVGNAVPPLLALEIARVVSELLN